MWLTCEARIAVSSLTFRNTNRVLQHIYNVYGKYLLTLANGTNKPEFRTSRLGPDEDSDPTHLYPAVFTTVKMKQVRLLQRSVA